MKSANAVVALVIAMLLTAAVMHATALPAREASSLPVLLDAATLVLTGEVASVDGGVEALGDWNGRRVPLATFTATAIIDRLYKGDINDPTVKLLYTRPTGVICNVSRCPDLVVGEYGLFFLHSLGNGYYSFDQLAGELPISRLKSSAHMPGAVGLESDLVAGLQEENETTLLTNIELLGALKDSKAVPPLLDWLAHNPNRPARASAYLSLLKLQHYSKLGEALAFAESFTGGTPSESRIASDVIDIVSAVRDPAAVPALTAFSHSPSDRVRESVIHALREIGSLDAVPAFVAALDDPVQLIRYDAVLGLATVEKRWDQAPSIDTFAASESKYIGFWKSWWLSSDRPRH